MGWDEGKYEQLFHTIRKKETANRNYHKHYLETGGFGSLFFLAILCGMWDLGSLTRNQTSGSLEWKHGVLTTGSPRKSQKLGFVDDSPRPQCIINSKMSNQGSKSSKPVYWSQVKPTDFFSRISPI